MEVFFKLIRDVKIAMTDPCFSTHFCLGCRSPRDEKFNEDISWCWVQNRGNFPQTLWILNFSCCIAIFWFTFHISKVEFVHWVFVIKTFLFNLGKTQKNKRWFFFGGGKFRGKLKILGTGLGTFQRMWWICQGHVGDWRCRSYGWSFHQASGVFSLVLDGESFFKKWRLFSCFFILSKNMVALAIDLFAFSEFWEILTGGSEIVWRNTWRSWTNNPTLSAAEI